MGIPELVVEIDNKSCIIRKNEINNTDNKFKVSVKKNAHCGSTILIFSIFNFIVVVSFVLNFPRAF